MLPGCALKAPEEGGEGGNECLDGEKKCVQGREDLRRCMKGRQNREEEKGVRIRKLDSEDYKQMTGFRTKSRIRLTHHWHVFSALSRHYERGTWDLWMSATA